MVTRIIPGYEEVICDGCRGICGNELTYVARKQKGRIIVEQDALDMHGDPCANGGVSFDLCDDCLNFVRERINMALGVLRGAPPVDSEANEL
jgi:uncharacterized cysteine cluster protein YcgN (CxxCxxCC family)